MTGRSRGRHPRRRESWRFRWPLRSPRRRRSGPLRRRRYSFRRSSCEPPPAVLCWGSAQAGGLSSRCAVDAQGAPCFRAHFPVDFDPVLFLETLHGALGVRPEFAVHRDVERLLQKLDGVEPGLRRGGRPRARLRVEAGEPPPALLCRGSAEAGGLSSRWPWMPRAPHVSGPTSPSTLSPVLFLEVLHGALGDRPEFAVHREAERLLQELDGR